MQACEKILSMKDQIKIHSSIEEVGSECWIIVVHGIGEHSLRHHYISELFGTKFNIFYYDLRGHGRSGGPRAWVSHFDQFSHDLSEIILFLERHYKMKEYILFGHSMGALITANFIQNFDSLKLPQELYPSRVVINAPPVGYPGILGEVVKYSPTKIFDTLAKLKVGVPLGGLVDLNFLSHGPEVSERYVEDALNCLKLHTKLVLGMVHTSKKVFERALVPRCEMFVSYGTEDKIIGVMALKHYFTFIEKAAKLTEFKGAYHEIHNEIQKYRTPYFDYLKKIFA